MPNQTTAIAHPNIAFIKYWGNRDNDLRLPVNGSISMNLESLTTQTVVEIQPVLLEDKLIINGRDAARKSTKRISQLLDLVRKMSERKEYALVSTVNNFPVGSGIASSASGFAALAMAASTAYGLNLSEKDLSRLARRGSGSARPRPSRWWRSVRPSSRHGRARRACWRWPDRPCRFRALQSSWDPPEHEMRGRWVGASG